MHNITQANWNLKYLETKFSKNTGETQNNNMSVKYLAITKGSPEYDNLEYS
jgi:hypothetical protein